MLKKYRLKINMTMSKLSEITYTNERTILRIEKDQSIPKVDTFARIVIALNMSNDEIANEIKKLANKK